MMSALSTAGTGMNVSETAVQVLTNNIANINTTGYKKYQAQTSDLFYQEYLRAGSVVSSSGNSSPAGINVGVGSHITGTYRITTQGDGIQTNNPLDLMIQGNGYFMVTDPNGNKFYTRDGTFELDSNKKIVSVTNGYLLSPGITVPTDSDSVTINNSGEVYAKRSGVMEQELLGQIELHNFANDKGLVPIGDNLYAESEASGASVANSPETGGVGKLRSGWLEASNTNLIEDISNLIRLHRALESAANCVQTIGEMMKKIVDIRG